jgi:hypothetical protein
MKRREVGRISIGDIKVIEYEPMDLNDKNFKFFVQSGVAGFYASDEDLRRLYTLLGYYHNIDLIQSIKITLAEEA